MSAMFLKITLKVTIIHFRSKILIQISFFVREGNKDFSSKNTILGFGIVGYNYSRYCEMCKLYTLNEIFGPFIKTSAN